MPAFILIPIRGPQMALASNEGEDVSTMPSAVLPPRITSFCRKFVRWTFLRGLFSFAFIRHAL